MRDLESSKRSDCFFELVAASKMVMFVCNVCGASLKKNKVEEHYRYKCRKCDAVSCMDCGQDFWGDDYILHNKCISEQEKYQGVCSENKGDHKQEQWVANVNAAISTYSGSDRVRSLLQNCVTCPNLPRKQAKFTNFVASSFHEYNKGVVQEAWSIIEKASKLTITGPNETPVNGQISAGVTNGEVAVEPDEAEKPPRIENGHSKKEKKPVVNGKSSPELETKVSDDSEEDNEKEETEEDEEEEKAPRKNGADSAKLKMRKQKLDRKKELASYQNLGKKLSKKQLKRIREDSISADLAASANEETNGATCETNRKDKKHKKKDRLGAKHFPSEPNDVIKEYEEEDERSAQSVLAKAQLDSKLMAGVPKNENIEPDEDDDDDDASGAASNSRFNWHKAIKSVLKAEDDLSLPVKKLRKKVLAEFVSSLGGDMSKFKSEHEVWALFDKKLHSYPKAKILKDRVTLIK